jgi:hypothetical protein
LAFLEGRRNPYVTLELFPKQSEIDAVLNKNRMGSNPFNNDPRVSVLAKSERRLSMVGNIDEFGGENPKWNLETKMPFKEPRVSTASNK